MTTSPDLEQLARGLTEAQRKAILALIGEWQVDDSTNALVRLLWSEEAKALRPRFIEYRKRRATLSRPLHEMRLTPLGLALRDHLRKQS